MKQRMVTLKTRSEGICWAASIAATLFLARFAFVTSGSSLGQTSEASPQNGEQIRSRALLLSEGARLDFQITSNECRDFDVVIDSPQYVRFLIDKIDLHLRATLLGPHGNKIADVPSRGYGTTQVPVVLRSSGVYRLEIRSLEHEDVARPCSIGIAETRPAMVADARAVEAETAFAYAENLREESKEESLRQALDGYRDAYAKWQLCGSRAGAARSLEAIGDVYYLLSDYKNALESYRQALSLSKASGDERAHIRSLNGVALSSVYLDKTHEALLFSTRALRQSRVLGDRSGEAQALNNIGKVHYFSSDVNKALGSFREALSLWTELGDRWGQAQVLNNIGYAYYDLRDIHLAMDHYGRALSLWRSVGDRRGEALSLTAIGSVHSYLGEKQTALEYHSRAVEIFREIGNRSGEANTLTGIAYLFEDLGDHDRALEAYGRAVHLFHTIGDRVGESLATLYIGRVYYSLSNNQQALRCYSRVLSLSPVNYRLTEAYAFDCIGMVYSSLQNRRAALSYYRRALSLYRVIGDRAGQAYTLNNIGCIHYASRKIRSALSDFGQALPLSTQTEDVRAETLTLYNMARAQRDIGDLRSSLSKLDLSLKLVESLRTKVAGQDLRASYFASVRQQYELYVDVLMRLHDRNPTGGFDAIALEASERARSRSFLDMLGEAHADIRQDVSPSLLATENSLQEQLGQQERLHLRQQLLVANQRKREVEGSEETLADLVSRYEDTEAKIRASSPRYAAITRPEAMGLSEVQHQIPDPDTILLEYLLGDERSYLWAVTQSAIYSYRIPRRDILESAAMRIYEQLSERRLGGWSADSEFLEEAKTLSDILLGPVRSELGTKRLLVVGDGALLYLPFSVLPIRGTSNAKDARHQDMSDLILLASQHEIVYLPSASAWALMRTQTADRKPAPKLLAVFADPVLDSNDPRLTGLAHEPQASGNGGLQRSLRDFKGNRDGFALSRLLFSREEADAIMSVVPPSECLEALGFKASLATVMNPDIGQYRILHFATHGLLNDKHPELSGMVLSLLDEAGNEQNGFLGLQEVYKMNLAADLVVLSACQTGLGKQIRGEGLVGLARGFMYAGASSVLASLWKVDDEATADLMRRFYEKMLREGQRPAAALRASQVEMQSLRRWRDPYYWAAFVLQGDFR
jgi:CHAT domain-containing protein/tetratricopeptide (TPR) repeat protein